MAGTVPVQDSTFAEQVLGATLPTVVDFWAPWCGPCRVLAPLVEELAKELAGKVVFAKLNTDENPATPAQYGVQAIPALVLFRNGKEVDRIIGARPKDQLRALITAKLLQAA